MAPLDEQQEHPSRFAPVGTSYRSDTQVGPDGRYILHSKVQPLGNIVRRLPAETTHTSSSQGDENHPNFPDYASHVAAHQAAREQSQDRAVDRHVQRIGANIDYHVCGQVHNEHHLDTRSRDSNSSFQTPTAPRSRSRGRSRTLQSPRSPHAVSRSRTPTLHGPAISRYDRSRTPTPQNPTGAPDFTMTATTPARSGVSPSSSPRLPSPPPFTEVQFGPQSPTVGEANSEFSLGDATRPDEGAARRIRPGTKAEDMRSGPPLVPLNQLDSPFQLQEHIKALHWDLTHPDKLNKRYSIAINKETALILARAPELSDGETVDKNLWLYEICRFCTQQANSLILGLFTDTPPCSAETCPEMRASEWQYLCAVHDPPKSCAAIDYCCHTLDWAANVLTSPKHFPSRLTLGGGDSTGTNAAQSMRHLVNIFRRVYRIFAHLWFQHLDMFWTVEARYGCYVFFKTVCDVYALVPEDNYTIPVEAEGSREDQEETPVSTDAPNFNNKFQILKKPALVEHATQEIPHNEAATTIVSVGATTRRHKHTPSTGSAVTTISESIEEDESAMQDDFADPPLPPPPPPPTANTDDLAAGLGRLDLAGSLPAFEFRAPEDPTPTAHDVDLMAAAGAESPRTVEVTEEEVTEQEDEEAKEPEREEGQEELVAKKEGGGGEDVLGAILGHMEGAEPEETEKTEGAEGEEEEAEEIGEPIAVPATALP